MRNGPIFWITLTLIMALLAIAPLFAEKILLTYWTNLALVGVTVLYVKATQEILGQAREQAKAMQSQVEASRDLLKTTEQDLAQSFRPVLVPITDFSWVVDKFTRPRFTLAPVSIQNVGKGSALNIQVEASFLGSCASKPTQPFLQPSLVPNQSVLLGELTSIGSNPLDFVIREMSVKIKCSDVLGRTHETKYENGKLLFTSSA